MGKKKIVNIDKLLLEAINQHKLNNLQEAERLYKQILQHKPKHADANHNMGILATQYSKHELAIQFYKKALKQIPNNEQFKKSLNNALQKVGNSDKPSEKEINHLASLYSKGEYIEALPLAEKMTQEFPKEGFGFKVIGIVNKKLGNTQKALVAMQKSLELTPNDFQSHNNLGNLLLDLERLPEAEKHYRIAIELKPDYALAYYNLGAVLRKLDKLAEAERFSLKAIELDKNYAEPHNNLGAIYQKIGKFSEAEEYLIKAIELKPDYAQAYSNLGITLQELKRLEESEKAFLKAIEIDPEFADAYNNLAALLEKIPKLFEAEKCYLKSLELKPDSAVAHNNLGRLFYYFDRVDDAVNSYKESFKLDQNSFGLKASVNLAVLYFLKDNLKESFHYLEASAEIAKLSTDETYKNDAVYREYLTQLLLSDNNTNRKDSNTTQLHKIFVIGESHSLGYHNLIVNYDDKETQCISEWILGCKQWHLGNSVKNKYKYKFESILARLPKNSAVLLSIGEIDCRYDEGILSAWRKSEDKTLEEIILKTIKSYLSYIININVKYNHKIIIAGVPAPNNITDRNKLTDEENDVIKLRELFNKSLKEEVSSLNISFLDIYSLTNTGNGIGNNEYYIDSHHLTPLAISEALSNYIIS